MKPDLLIAFSKAESDALAEHFQAAQAIRHREAYDAFKPFKDRQLDAALEHLRKQIAKTSAK